MRTLDGSNIAGFVKQRQVHQVRGLRQARKVAPKLVFVCVDHEPSRDSYIKDVETYGSDVLVDVEVLSAAKADIKTVLAKLNKDHTVHGVVLRMDDLDAPENDTVLNMVEPHKDVGGLGDKATFDAPTAVAIMWLLAGYNIDLPGKKIVVIGKNRAVGAPLARIWKNDGLGVQAIMPDADDLQSVLLNADIVVSSAHRAGLITSDMLKVDTVVIDAGLPGDVASSVHERGDIKFGSGPSLEPLAISALIDNIIRSAAGAKKS